MTQAAPASGDNLRIDGARLWDALMAMAEIGATPKGGCNRQTLTDLDCEGRALFARWCEQAGMTVAVDAIGTMFARRAGVENHLSPVLIGSHLDTQPTGGKFDGVLGVLGALEVVRTLNDLGLRTRRPIEVVNWTNEEGARFAPSMTASGVFAGRYTLEEALDLRDRDGKRLGDELARIGYAGDAPVGGRPIHACFELHIEQGPILEDEGLDIGVVTHAQGLRWYDIELVGFESHAGSTPMKGRRDALVGAARIVEATRRVALAHPPSAVGTCGLIEARPGSRNVIPGSVFLSAEIRCPDAAALDAMDAQLRAAVREIAAAERLDVEMRETAHYAPVAFDAGAVAAVRGAATALGLRHRDIVSGAGHDACWMAQVCPTAMIFTPCVDGVSHNEAESITPAWASAGADVLLRVALEAAGPI
jgi:N-carbamoyl-L-amino-acid hydrolase